MKSLLVALLGFSFSVLADQCQVSIIDSQGYIFDTIYTAQDTDCMYGVRMCRDRIVYASLNRATCRVMSRVPDAGSRRRDDYRPSPIPAPTPVPPPRRPQEPTPPPRRPDPIPTPTSGNTLPPQSGTTGNTIPLPRM